MMVCFSTPRPSTNYDGTNKEGRNDIFRGILRQICLDTGLHYREDAARNILVSNSTLPKAKVCFQGHMDVVVSKNESTEHDFETEGVDVQLTSEGTVKPIKGITLGADNGVAIAAGLAVLINHKSTPMELLITKNEETDFSGASALDASMITADTMLNLDSEVESQICAGSAGGFDQSLFIPIERAPASTEPFWTVKVKDMKGGHSGMDICREKTNAILAMHRVVLANLQKKQFRILSINGGTARNAIPRECTLVVQCNADVIEIIKNNFNTLKQEIQHREDHACIEVEQVKVDNHNAAYLPLTEASTRKLLNIIAAFPNGVMHTVPETHDTQSSLNFGVLKLKEASNEASANFFVRSTSESWMKFFSQKLTAIGNLVGARVDEYQGYLGCWEPVYGSNILKKLVETHPPFKIQPKTYTIHAGLECSTLVERFNKIGRKIECASIGPQIENAHSPDECLYIDSAVHFVKWTEAVSLAL